MRQSQSGLGHQNRLQIRRGWGAKGTVLARGTTDADINVESSGPTTLVFQRVTIQPGGYTGWHTHPGPLLVVVHSGTLTHCDRHCEVRTYTAGRAFEEPGGRKYVHMGANHGREPVVLDVTYVVPAGGPLRNDVSGPGWAARWAARRSTWGHRWTALERGPLAIPS